MALASLVKPFSNPWRASSLFGSVAASSLNFRPSREMLSGLREKRTFVWERNEREFFNSLSTLFFTCYTECPQCSCSGKALFSRKSSARAQSWWSPGPRRVDAQRSPSGGWHPPTGCWETGCPPPTAGSRVSNPQILPGKWRMWKPLISFGFKEKIKASRRSLDGN